MAGRAMRNSMGKALERSVEKKGDKQEPKECCGECQFSGKITEKGIFPEWGGGAELLQCYANPPTQFAATERQADGQLVDVVKNMRPEVLADNIPCRFFYSKVVG